MSDPANNKRSPASRSRPGPRPAAAAHEELFRTLYAAALQGCATQFESTPYINRRANYCDGKAEIERAQVIARRAWNTAQFGMRLFETDSFNNEVDLF